MDLRGGFRLTEYECVRGLAYFASLSEVDVVSEQAKIQIYELVSHLHQ